MTKLKREFPEKQLREYLGQVYPVFPKTAELDLDRHFESISDVQQLKSYLNEAKAAAEMRGMWKDAFTGPLIVVILGIITVAAALIATQIDKGDLFTLTFYGVGYSVIAIAGSAIAVQKAAVDAKRRVANLLIKEAIERRLAQLESK